MYLLPHLLALSWQLPELLLVAMVLMLPKKKLNLRWFWKALMLHLKSKSLKKLEMPQV